MRDYVIELIETYVAGKLRMDYIYPKSYDYLFGLGLLPALDSEEALPWRKTASLYHTLFESRFLRRLQDVKGELVTEEDLRGRLETKDRRIDNYMKKLLVYNLFASGKPINLPQIPQHANDNAPAS